MPSLIYKCFHLRTTEISTTFLKLCKVFLFHFKILSNKIGTIISMLKWRNWSPAATKLTFLNQITYLYLWQNTLRFFLDYMVCSANWDSIQSLKCWLLISLLSIFPGHNIHVLAPAFWGEFIPVVALPHWGDLIWFPIHSWFDVYHCSDIRVSICVSM